MEYIAPALHPDCHGYGCTLRCQICPGAKIREGNNLVFLHQHLSSLPIPRLWAMYEEDEDVFIIMEYCEGNTIRYLAIVASLRHKRHNETTSEDNGSTEGIEATRIVVLW